MRNCNLLRLLTLSGFLSLAVLPRHAVAQWPTLDISSVKEGISTNIELVKQSKVVTDAMATAAKSMPVLAMPRPAFLNSPATIWPKPRKNEKASGRKRAYRKEKEEYEKLRKKLKRKRGNGRL